MCAWFVGHQWARGERVEHALQVGAAPGNDVASLRRLRARLIVREADTVSDAVESGTIDTAADAHIGAGYRNLRRRWPEQVGRRDRVVLLAAKRQFGPAARAGLKCFVERQGLERKIASRCERVPPQQRGWDRTHKRLVEIGRAAWRERGG